MSAESTGTYPGILWYELGVGALSAYLPTGENSYRAIRFVIYGEPLGYRATGGKWNKVTRKTIEWYKHCAGCAEMFGLELPLYADSVYPVFIHTRAYYSKKRHCDPQNTSKGLIDALFYGAANGGDKYVGGSWDAPLYDKFNPRLEVEIRAPHLFRKHPALVSVGDTSRGFANSRKV